MNRQDRDRTMIYFHILLTSIERHFPEIVRRWGADETTRVTVPTRSSVDSVAH